MHLFLDRVFHLYQVAYIIGYLVVCGVGGGGGGEKCSLLFHVPQKVGTAIFMQ